MRPALLFLLFAAIAPAGDPEPLVRLGSDRFRQANRVEALAYSTDGKRLVSVDSETIYLWDASDGRLLRTIVGPEKRKLFAVHFNADATAVFAVALDEKKNASLIQFNSSDGKTTNTTPLMAADKDGFNEPAIAFSPDGTWVAVRRGDGQEVAVMDTAIRKVTWSERQPDNKFYSLTFRLDSRGLAVGGWDGQIRLVDPKAGRVTHQYALSESAVWNLAFSPNGNDLAAGVHAGSETDLVLFEATTSEVRWKHRADSVVALFFTADGKSVAYFGPRAKRGEEPDRWHWLDAATGMPLGSSMDTGWQENGLRPDGRVLSLGGRHGQISQWDLVERKQLVASADPPSAVLDLAVSPDGATVRGWSDGLYEWDRKTGQQSRLVPHLGSPDCYRAAISDDRGWAARIRAKDFGLEVTGLKTGQTHRPETDYAEFTWLRFRGDGRLILRGQFGLTVVDPPTNKQIALVTTDGAGTVTSSGDGLTAVTVVPTGNLLRAVRHDLTTGEPLGKCDARLPDPSMMERSRDWRARLSPDGRVLAVCFDYLAFAGMGFNDIYELHTALFDARTGRYLSGWYDIHSRADLAFSPDGRTVACYYSSGLGVDIRETATGHRRTRRSNPPVTSACFTPDGRILALATSPGPVALWDLIGKPTGKWADVKADELWTALAGENAEEAFDAIRHLRRHPAEAIGLLKERMKISTAPAADWVAERLKGLDAPAFRDREKATADLAEVDDLVGPALRAALKGASPEARERINGLLPKTDAMTPDKLRAIRACEALEGIGSTEARDVLAAWAKGPPGSALTREAKESLERHQSRARSGAER